MNKQTKIYLGLAALGLAGFLFWKSKKTASKTAFKVQSPTYPAGLKEGDLISKPIENSNPANPLEFMHILKEGKKLPVTYEWWMSKFGDDFSNVKIVTDNVFNSIPTIKQ